MTSDAPRLRYDDGCLAAHALNVVGDRWALLVVRELSFRPKRFQAIRAGLPGVSAAVLSQRLRDLGAAGVVVHDAEMGSYALTPSGHGLRPVLAALCRWGVERPGHDPHRFISPTALALSMTALIDREAAAGQDLVAGLSAPREAFTLRPDAAGALIVTPASRPEAQFTLCGDGNALARAVYGPSPVAALVRAGAIGLEGDAAAAQAFVDLFALRAAPSQEAEDRRARSDDRA